MIRVCSAHAYLCGAGRGGVRVSHAHVHSCGFHKPCSFIVCWSGKPGIKELSYSVCGLLALRWSREELSSSRFCSS